MTLSSVTSYAAKICLLKIVRGLSQVIYKKSQS